MKIFKTVDLFIQLFIICAMGINYFRDGGRDTALLCVIGFGAYQVLSSLIHLFVNFNKTWWRLSYSFTGVAILFLMLFIKFNLITEANFIKIMLVLAPIMGVFYFILCCTETYRLYTIRYKAAVLIGD